MKLRQDSRWTRTISISTGCEGFHFDRTELQEGPSCLRTIFVSVVPSFDEFGSLIDLVKVVSVCNAWLSRYAALLMRVNDEGGTT